MKMPEEMLGKYADQLQEMQNQESPDSDIIEVAEPVVDERNVISPERAQIKNRFKEIENEELNAPIETVNKKGELDQIKQIEDRIQWLSDYRKIALEAPDMLTAEDKARTERYILDLGAGSSDLQLLDKLTERAQSVTTDGFIKDKQQFKKDIDGFKIYYIHLKEKKLQNLTRDLQKQNKADTLRPLPNVTPIKQKLDQAFPERTRSVFSKANSWLGKKVGKWFGFKFKKN